MGLIPGLGKFPGAGHGNPFNIFAWRIPWTEEPGGYSSQGHKESDTTEATQHAHTEKTTRQFTYDLNQVPYDYAVEVMFQIQGIRSGRQCT